MKLKTIAARKDLFYLLLILVLGLIPRLWSLREAPPMIVDEPANIRDMQKLINYGSFHPIDYEWGYGQATLVHYPAIALSSLGFDEFMGIRLTSVILSLLALIPFYFIVKKQANRIIALCCTIMFSYSYFYLQFSRVGWTNIHSLALGLFFIWFIQLALEKKSYLLTLLAGIIGGLGIYTYRAGEIYILAGFILFFAIVLKLKLKEKINFSLIFVSSFIVTSLPWILKILSNWELYSLRSRVVSIANVNLPYHGLTDKGEIMKYQLITTIKSWILLLPVNGGGIEDPRYVPLNHGLVSPFVAILIVGGFFLAIYHFRNNFIWMLMFIIGLYFGQVLTVDPPNGSRGLILLPVLYIFSSLSLYYLYNKLKKIQHLDKALIIASLAIAFYDFYFYMQWMSWIKLQ